MTKRNSTLRERVRALEVTVGALRDDIQQNRDAIERLRELVDERTNSILEAIASVRGCGLNAKEKAAIISAVIMAAASVITTLIQTLL